MSTPNAQAPGRRRLFYTFLLLVTTGLMLTAQVAPLLAPLSSLSLEVGQVSPQNFPAIQNITYTSEVLTEQQREAAALAVPFIYTSPDPSVARRQLENFRNTLAYITSVRADPYDTPEQKLADLAALEYIHINTETASSILELSDSRWQAIHQEAMLVLEQVMRNTIREDRLDDARRNVPALVSLSLPEEQAALVAELVETFVAPNSLYSESLSEAARQKARQAVTPVTRSYIAGETVVQRGQVITATDLEALQELGLVQPQSNWKELTSTVILVLLAIAFMVSYLLRNRQLLEDVRGVTLITILFLVFLIGGRLIIPNHTVIPYVYPLAAYGLIVAVLIGTEPALIFSLALSILVAYDLPNALDLTLYYILSSLFGVLTLGRARRLTAFIWAGATVASSGAIVIIAYRLPQSTTDLIGIATLLGASFINGIASASLTVLLQFFLAQFLGMTTALQLMEISRPDHPLLQLILRNAPGTYQHSLQLANLSEQAAEQIGADTLLTRVGALYHDAGKSLNPIFFIENQVPGSLNPHDELDPLSSSQTIIRHVADGLELARKHRLPSRIHEFIREHHGTTITRYQYVKAVEAAGGDEKLVDIEQFRYPGPRPRSRETAILMLADTCEARVRAERPNDKNELRVLIKDVIDNRVLRDQLDETNLSLRDLETVASSFITTLRGIYHPRIEYPKLEKDSVPSEDPMEAAPIPAPQLISELPTLSQPDHPQETPEAP